MPDPQIFVYYDMITEKFLESSGASLTTKQLVKAQKESFNQESKILEFLLKRMYDYGMDIALQLGIKHKLLNDMGNFRDWPDLMNQIFENYQYSESSVLNNLNRILNGNSIMEIIVEFSTDKFMLPFIIGYIRELKDITSEKQLESSLLLFEWFNKEKTIITNRNVMDFEDYQILSSLLKINLTLSRKDSIKRISEIPFAEEWLEQFIVKRSMTLILETNETRELEVEENDDSDKMIKKIRIE